MNGTSLEPNAHQLVLTMRFFEMQEITYLTAAAVERKFYMDDFFKSVETVARALKIYRELVELCKKGKFRLTKWISNEREVIDQIPESERAASVKSIDEHTAMPTERALGVGWDTQRDHFVFKVKKRNPAITRRQVLSLIASLFDPLRFLVPFLVRAKIILQRERIWQLGVAWDDCLPHETSLEWKEWEGELNMLAEFSVPRFYRHIDDKPVTIQLHVFGDASELAFCSVVYFRFACGDGSVKIALVLAKTRVAPRKQLSIPRLELQAAVLNAILECVAVKEHDYEVDEVYYWSDSTTVLHWIRGTAKRHPPFIANRLGEILDSTEPNQWRYCPSKLNPADDGCRGLPVSVITPSSRWLSGPDYLRLEDLEWPEDKTIQPTEDDSVEKEEIPEIQWSGKASVKEEYAELIELNKYSSYFRSLSVVAYIVRFIHNCRIVATERLVGPLSIQEIEKAKTILIQQAQVKSFPPDVAALRKGVAISNKSKLISLSPFLDEDYVMRAGDRLEKADISFTTRHPVILASDHELTRLIVMNCHNKLCHAGVDNVRNELRQQFWILRCKATVRKLLHQCSFCKRRRVQPRPPKMAGLPRDRLLVASPFTNVGVDYFGPMEVTYLRRRF